VTGNEAEKAEKLAAKYQADIEALAGVVDAAIKSENVLAATAEVNELTKIVEVAQVSVPKRAALVDSVKKLKMKIIDFNKKQMKERVEKIKTETDARIKNGLVEQPEVLLLDAGSNNKVLNDIIKIYNKSSKETCVMLFSVDRDAGKVLILCSTPKGSPLKANEWVNSCAGIVGGKGGGKDVQAQASGKETENVAQALELARKFAATKL